VQQSLSVVYRSVRHKTIILHVKKKKTKSWTHILLVPKIRQLRF